MIQPARHVSQKLRRLAGVSIAVIVASAVLPALPAADPPKDLARLVAHRESETQAERNRFTYRQTVRVEELTERGTRNGEYRETRDIIFSPAKEREDVIVTAPRSTLKNLILTEEDFADIRNIQPFVLVEDLFPIYETKFKGEQPMGGEDCWVLQVKPRQILQGQRLFEGLLWVRKQDYSVVQSEGQAVPQIRTTKSENLFPRFTTIRRKFGDFWFPTQTIADDTLFFRGGPQRIKLSVRYENYRKFGSDTNITFIP
jgi:hypothetical protein